MTTAESSQRSPTCRPADRTGGISDNWSGWRHSPTGALAAGQKGTAPRHGMSARRAFWGGFTAAGRGQVDNDVPRTVGGGLEAGMAKQITVCPVADLPPGAVTGAGPYAIGN